MVTNLLVFVIVFSHHLSSRIVSYHGSNETYALDGKKGSQKRQGNSKIEQVGLQGGWVGKEASRGIRIQQRRRIQPPNVQVKDIDIPTTGVPDVQGSFSH